MQKHRGFIAQFSIPGFIVPGFIGQNTQTPGGSSKINPWIFSVKSEEPPVLEKNPDKSPVLRKFR
jgi:hypothetical protein